jgi:hypothetical protein
MGRYSIDAKRGPQGAGGSRPRADGAWTNRQRNDGTLFSSRQWIWKKYRGMPTVTAGQTIQSIDGKLKPGHDWRLQVTDEFANTLRELQVSARKPKQGRVPAVFS